MTSLPIATTTTADEGDEKEVTRIKVAVVGAGAAGLMCTHQLLTTGVVDLEEIIILEARDRVGGRIHTTTETIETATTRAATTSREMPNDPPSSENTANHPVEKIYRDHGAAWVHGTGFDWPNYCSPKEGANGDDKVDIDDHYEGKGEEPTPTNPMMELLQQATPKGENVCLTHLEPTFSRGNPWMRPGHVCVQPNQLVLFVDGIQIGGSCKNGDNDEAEDGNGSQDASIFNQALKEHYDTMNQVGRIGYDLIVNGRSQEAVDQSFQTALDQVLAAATESSKSKSGINDNRNAAESSLVPLVAAFYTHLIECWHGTSASGLQLHEFSAHVQGDDDDDDDMDDQYTDEGDFYGPHCTMKKGMQTVLEPLCETASPCIRLKEAVRRIQYQQYQQQTSQDLQQNELIRIETSSGMIIEADYCVLTVPLGCLAESIRTTEITEVEDSLQTEGTILFEPSLSCAKIEAIHHMNMGCYKKVFLTMDRIFWPTAEAFLGLVRSSTSLDNESTTKDGIGNHLLIDNLWAQRGIPCVEAILIGNAGTWGTGKPDDVICNAVLQFLADAMGLDYTMLQEWCVDCHITRWEEDPFSRGAYSGYKLGTTEDHTKGLATSEWDGRLLFAGEATLSGYEGSVHAALISGETAAEAIKSGLPLSSAK